MTHTNVYTLTARDKMMMPINFTTLLLQSFRVASVHLVSFSTNASLSLERSISPVFPVQYRIVFID